jgi:carbon storage regulator CsrA
MLVLARRLNEKIVLPGLGITVQVLGVHRGTVRLGIDAPADVTVLRDELVGRGQADADLRDPESCPR